MQLCRFAGTVAVVSAFGLPHPFLAGLVILPALDLAGAVPLTPGSFGVGSGAVAVALSSRGIGMTDALATGLAIQGVETLVSVTCGSLGLAYLMQPSERVRRAALRVAVVGGSAVLAGLVGLASPVVIAWFQNGRAGTSLEVARTAGGHDRTAPAGTTDPSRRL
jgi:hypothetical protein